MYEQKEKSIEDGEYEAAEEFEITFRDKVRFWWDYVKTSTMMLLLLIPETLRGIKNFFIPPKPKTIENQVALVTGGGNGLGRAIAFRLAKEKCKLAIVDIDLAAAQQTAQEIRDTFNVSAVAFKVDVSKHEEISKLKTDVENTLGNVDILVNNAGLLSMNVSLREGTSHFWVKL
jgi:all-trans-retinol dehydrogenase (NAD+)